MSAFTDALGTTTATKPVSTVSPFMSALGIQPTAPAKVANPNVPTQYWNGQQIPANIATKNLVAYDPITGNKTFNLGNAGPGVYTVDKNNQIVKGGHTTYGGVQPVAGMQRDDIIPQGLGGTNSNAGNINLIPNSVAQKQDTIESLLANEVKKGQIQPKAAITQALADKQAIAKQPGFWGKVGNIVGDVGRGLVQGAKMITGQTQQQDTFQNPATAFVQLYTKPSEMVQQAEKGVPNVPILKQTGQLVLRTLIPIGEGFGINVGGDILGANEQSNAIADNKTVQTVGKQVQSTGQENLITHKLNAEDVVNVAINSINIATLLAPFFYKGATEGSLKVADALEKNSKVPLTYQDAQKITSSTSDAEATARVGQEKLNAYKEAANTNGVKQAVKQGYVELAAKDPNAFSQAIRSAATKPITDLFSSEKPNIKPIPETPTEQYANPGVAKNLALAEQTKVRGLAQYNELNTLMQKNGLEVSDIEKGLGKPINESKPMDIALALNYVKNNLKTPIISPQTPKTAPETTITGKVGNNVGQPGGRISMLDKQIMDAGQATLEEARAIKPQVIKENIGLAPNFDKRVNELLTEYRNNQMPTVDEMVQRVQAKQKQSLLDKGFKPLDPLTQEARKYKSAEEFVKAYENKTKKVGEIAFRDTSEQIPKEAQTLHDAFMEYAQKPETQKIYEYGGNDTKVLTDIWNKANTPTEKPTENAQSGFVSPQVIGESVKGKITSAKDLIAQTKTGLTASSNLEDSLFKIKQAAKADKLQAAEMIKNSPMTNADAEAIYHYQENKSEPLTPKQQELYNTEIKPLADESARIVAKLKPLIPINEENYTPRFVKGKGGLLDRLVEKDKIMKGGMGNQLSKSAPSLQKRTMKVLIDDKGNRTVVSIKNGIVTKFENGEQTVLGNEKQPIIPKQKEYFDKIVMEKLNKLAKDLGIKHERLITWKGRWSRAGAGVSYTGQNLVRTKVASPEDILLHEIGHQIDDKYGMQAEFVNNSLTKVELRKLADLRFEGQEVKPSYERYVRKGEEKMAVMFQAYLANPARFQEIAPNTFKKFTDFLASKPELKPILDIKPSLVLDSETYGGNPNIPGMFVDKNGKSYKIAEATTKEIEANTNLTYYHNALVNNTINYLKLRQAERAVDFLEAYKESPEFKTIAVKFGEGLAPDGWRPSALRTFSGYVFEPHVAAVLDDFNKSLISGSDPLKILTGINSFLRTSIFFNPLIHVPNITNHWFVARGITPFVNPKAYPTLIKTSIKAINAVLRQNSDYVDMLKQGANLLYADENVKNLNALLLQKMSANIETDPQLKFFRETFPNFVKWLNPYKLSGKITWAVNDIATMQSIYENMESGMTMEQAIQETGKHIPNYRIPANVLGSEAVSKFLKNPNITMFSAYHYGAIHSYVETAKDIFKGNLKEKANAANRLAMLALITLVLYPQLDKLAKKITGNAKAQFRRAGASTFAYQTGQLMQGKIDAGQYLTTFLTPAPATKETLQQIFNLDFFTGQPIRTSGQTGMTQLKESGLHAGLQISPAQQYQRITSGSISGKDYISSLFGISSPKSTPTEKIIQNMIYDEKPKLQAQLKPLVASGKTTEAQKLVNDFNDRLKAQTIQALKDAGQSTDNIDAKLKSQYIKLPGIKAMQNYNSGKGKTPLQKVLK